MDKESWVSNLRIGQRVVRKDSEERGTVTEANGTVKVKWDGGSTSYFSPDQVVANVKPDERT